ncbi:MAG: hypothetical protein GF416_06555 [Candidatus Altiarchaeales archaeon]|nr:hypothetical protein [Candidatus Altiarchaeales archaeon]MBD3416776.1 hypothetical protein [Candidatus Altiarchaeales archaeon]
MRVTYAVVVLTTILVCGCVSKPARVDESSTTTTLRVLNEDYVWRIKVQNSTNNQGKISHGEVSHGVDGSVDGLNMNFGSEGASQTPATSAPTSTTLDSRIKTFEDRGGSVCRVDGKPIIRMYSKNSCHNCEWSAPIFDRVASEYMEKGLIKAHHWVFDVEDDTLTERMERSMPDGEYEVFYEGNEIRTVPYFSFGCRFTRVGNGYQVRDDKEKEEEEYRALIEQMISG